MSASLSRLLRRSPSRRGVALLWAVLMGMLAPMAPSALAAATPMVQLGDASSYAVLSGASVGNTVSAAGAPHTTLRGDLGVKVNTQPTGFPPGVVTGAIHVGDTAAVEAHADVVAAYNEVAGRTGGAPLAGALAGATIKPGLHTVAGAVSNTTTVTLDAENNPNAVFVFQVGGALAMAAGSHVVLANGAQASRVFWQVNGAGAVGANADFAGTLMALDAVAIGNGTMVNGRAFARNGALTLDANSFYSSPPVVTIAGGSPATTTDTAPTLSGTTDVESPGLVTVTIAGQTLTAAPSEGSWSVQSALLANGTYTATASVTDGAGNVGSATQELTVDTVLPVIAIDEGASRTTIDPTPTIAGVSDVAPGTTVRVTVDFQTLTALVQLDGTWNVTCAPLVDGDHTVSASVDDPAGNEGTDSQTLTVDTTAPAAAIAGGGARLTNDATPTIGGTADVPAGTTVTVDLADETLTGTVDSGGAWSVTASALSEGPHRIVMRVSDAVGNGSTVVQTLTIDTIPPIVAIAGGVDARTDDLSPTIRGTSDAAPDTTVTVTIAAQSMTTLLQGGGAWNATPDPIEKGTWAVVATVRDPAGNVGTAVQELTIGGSPAVEPPVAATPAPTATTAPPQDAPAQPATAPVFVLPTATAGAATIIAGVLTTGAVIRCPANATSNCTGTMLVYADATTRPKAKRLLIGRYSFKVKPGSRSRVVVKLNRSGKRRLARVKKLRATLVATTNDAQGRPVRTESRMTLRFKRKAR